MHRILVLALSVMLMSTTVAATTPQGSASIAGQVIDAESGQPIVGARVRLGLLTPGFFIGYNFLPFSNVPEASTGLDGGFQFSSLEGGGGYAVLVADTLRVRSLSGVQACRPASPASATLGCSVATGDGRFELAEGEHLLLPPIALAPAARLSGVLRDTIAQQPIVGARVADGSPPSPWISDPTGSDGAYVIDHLPLATYLPLISAPDHVTTRFDGQPCGWYNGCSAGAPIVLDQPIEYSFDVEIAPAARIYPEPSHAGVPVDSWSRLYSGLIPEQPTSEGRWFDALPAGTYTLLARPSGFVPQYFDGLPCPDEDCPDVVPTPIVVQAGETVHLPMTMVPTRWLSGRVIDAQTAEPIPNVVVQAGRLQQALLPWVFSVQTDAISGPDGSFTLVGLWEGALDLVTGNDQGYIDVRYPAVICQPHVDCNPGNGYPAGHFQIGPDSQIDGIDIALARGGAIAGTTHLFGRPRPAAMLVRHAIHSNFTIVMNGSKEGYQTETGLIPGPYHVIAIRGFQTQVYDGIPCSSSSTCPLDKATPVPVEGTATVDGIDFDFRPEGEQIFQHGFDD